MDPRWGRPQPQDGVHGLMELRSAEESLKKIEDGTHRENYVTKNYTICHQHFQQKNLHWVIITK